MNHSYFFAAILLLCTACQRRPQPVHNEVEPQSEVVVTDVSAASEHEVEQNLTPRVSLRQDTSRKWVPIILRGDTMFRDDILLGDTRLTYCVYEEDKELASGEVTDRFLLLSVAYKGRCIVDEREIQKIDFDSIIPPDWLTQVELYSCYPEYTEEGQIATLSLGIFQPDSDIGWSMLLSVDSLGRFSAREEELQWEED